MKKRLIFWSALVVLALAIMFVGMESSVTAQDEVTPQTATPQPSPTGNGGKAKWTVTSDELVSNYPKGFNVKIAASSSAGKITDATVFWEPAPGYVNRIPGKMNDDGSFTAEWLPTSSAMPAWVGINYWWDLIDEAGNNFQTTRIQSEYADHTRKWNHVESLDINMYIEDGLPESVGPDTIEAMKTQRPLYYRSWGFLLDYKPRAIIYKNFDSFAEWNPDFKPSGPTVVLGTTRAEWGATVQVYYQPARAQGYNFVSWVVVPHEVGHLYQQAAGGFVQGLDWFIEGDAGYFELKEVPSCVDKSKQMAADGSLPSLQGEGPGIRGSDISGYDVGCAFFYWLTDTYGPDAHYKLWSQISKGTSRLDALQSVTGLSFADMDTAFRKWLGMANPVAEPPLEFPTLEFPPTRAPKP
jgi:hypothetical protein